MILSIWTDILDKLNEAGDVVKNFFLENSRHTVLWLAIIIIGLVAFSIVFKALNKD